MNKQQCSFWVHLQFLNSNLSSFSPLSLLFSAFLFKRGRNMRFVELEDSISRFRFAQSCLGLAGCLCVCYAVWTPYWLKDGGLWAEWNNTKSEQTYGDGSVINGEQMFDLLYFPLDMLLQSADLIHHLLSSVLSLWLLAELKKSEILFGEAYSSFVFAEVWG